MQPSAAIPPFSDSTLADERYPLPLGGETRHGIKDLGPVLRSRYLEVLDSVEQAAFALPPPDALRSDTLIPAAMPAPPPRL